MTDLSLWQVAIDGALVISLLYMCYRFQGGSTGVGSGVNLTELRGLESSLKRLLSQGEQASGTLSKELSKRQSDMQDLLFDLQTAESRMNKTMDEASELRKNIRSLATKIEQRRESTEQENLQPKEIAEAERRLKEHPAAAAPVPPRRPSTPQEPRPSSSLHSEYNAIPEPPSFAGLAGSRSIPTTEPRQVPKPTKQAVNIYGEPLDDSERDADDAHSQRLVDSIEKEVVEQEQYEVKQSLEDIYGAADDMLRAGQSFEAVSSRTNLPLDEVRMLSQIIEREEAVREQSKSSGGSLGGPVRRETQVL